jgi:hypothetical protein
MSITKQRGCAGAYSDPTLSLFRYMIENDIPFISLKDEPSDFASREPCELHSLPLRL